MTIQQLQTALNKLGATPALAVDGKSGPATIKAIKSFQTQNGLKADGLVGPKTISLIEAKLSSLGSLQKRSNFSYLKKGGLMTTAKMKAKYGNPCDPKNLVVIDLPFPMKAAWDLKQTITKIQVHKLIAANMKNALNEILSVYGLNRIKELGMDLYGGCYACRQMRGGSSWSIHSWATAIDIDPVRNSLHTPFMESEFSKIEYKDLHEIFYKHGFINLGIEANMDSMHYQIAK